VDEGDEIRVGSLSFSVLACPGHTPGGLSYRIGDSLFTGDSLFKLSAGRTDFPGSSTRALRLTLERLMESLLPSLCVQASLICGLFTTLRVQRFNGVLVIVEINRDRPSERKAHVSAPPGFRLFTLPRHVRWALIAVAVLSVMMLTDANPLSGTLSTMGFALWRTLLQLEGAAVLVFLFTAHDPDRAAAAGLLSAALFVLAPTVLLVLGIGDPVFHFRRVPHMDDE